MKKHFVLIFVLGFLVSCASAGNEAVRNETMDSVGTKVTKGVTTKSQIRALYGEPTNVSLSDGGNEIWTYEYAHTSVKPVTLVPIVGLFAGGHDVDKNSVVFLFNKSDVMQNFTVHRMQTEAQMGGKDVGE